MSQFQQVACHQSAGFRIVQLDRINFQQFFPVVDDDKRNLRSQLVHLFLTAPARIAGVDNPPRAHAFHHPKIVLFDFQVSLRIADKDPVILLFCNFFDAMQQHHIVRIGEGRAEHNNQFVAVRLSSHLPLRNLISKLPGCRFYLFHSFPGERNIFSPVQDHGDGRLGYAGGRRHITRCHFFSAHITAPFCPLTHAEE